MCVNWFSKYMRTSFRLKYHMRHVDTLWGIEIFEFKMHIRMPYPMLLTQDYTTLDSML